MAAVVPPGISAPVQFSSAAPELPHRCLGSPRTGSGCTDIRLTFSKRSWTRRDSQEPVTAWPTVPRQDGGPRHAIYALRRREPATSAKPVSMKAHVPGSGVAVLAVTSREKVAPGVVVWI